MRDGLRSCTYLMVGSVLGLMWATALIVLLAVGVSTIVLIIGAPILVATARLVEFVAAHGVGRAARQLRIDLPPTTGAPSPHHVDGSSDGSSGRNRLARLQAAWPRQTVAQALVGVTQVLTAPVVFSVTVALLAVPLGILATSILVALGWEPNGWDDAVDMIGGEARLIILAVAIGLLTVGAALAAARRLADSVARRTLRSYAYPEGRASQSLMARPESSFSSRTDSM